jgi:hypothetical protein
MTDSLDLDTLASLGELVSAIAVVVSLVYLAYQVRQSTASLRTENYSRALERVSALQARLSSDAAFAAIVTRGAIDPSRLTAEERVQFTWTFYEMFGAFEFMFHQAESGALPREVWQRWSDTLAWWISLPGVQAWWLARPAPFSQSFTRHVDGRLQTGHPDAASAARWRAFLRGNAGISPDSRPDSKE